jgi:hypothetical protein
MFRFMTLMVLAALFLVPTGCASLHTQQQKPLTAFPFHHNSFDFRTAWCTAPSPQGLAVQGVLKNIRYPYVDDLEITVFLESKSNRIIADTTVFLAGVISKDEYHDFNVNLKNAYPASGNLLKFRIKYRAHDGNSIFSWVSDFTVDAITGALIPKEEEKTSND